jgi:hypothetical protein
LFGNGFRFGPGAKPVVDLHCDAMRFSQSQATLAGQRRPAVVA